MSRPARPVRLAAVTGLAALAVGALAACSGGDHSDHAPAASASSAPASITPSTTPSTTSSSGAPATTPSADPHASHGMGGHDHPVDGGPAPAGITPAKNPRFPVGSQARIATDHMPGMSGATATITGAFTTHTYAVNYTPTDGGAPVKDHRWVVQQELAGAGSARLPDGAPITITAGHMPGMKGAKGTVASSTDQTVYMVTYTAGGMTMTNHKWVVEDELRPVNG